LNDLSQIKYLVIDEADRMIQLGNFPQLTQILDAVQRQNPMSDGEDDEDDDEIDYLENSGTESIDRMLGLPGIPGESRVKMLNDDILKQIEAARQRTPAGAMDHSVGESEEYDEGSDTTEASDDEIVLPSLPPVNRQTFVFSATLSLPAVAATKATKQKQHNSTFGGAISEILEKAHAKGKTKVVDLSTNAGVKETSKASDKKHKQSNEVRAPPRKSKFQLPPGLALYQVKCTQKHKDSYLYAYLMTTKEGNSGPCLVFCNSIAAVRRVGKTLEMLGINVMILHAKMQQVCFFVVAVNVTFYPVM
jgi:ATP-dependent RNA helicase DDX24/MAK5